MSFALVVAASIAICGSALLARNVSPSATFFNQAVALVGWGVLLAFAAAATPPALRSPWRRVAPAVLALGLTAIGVVLASALERLPAPLAWSALGLLAAAVLALVVADRSAQHESESLFKAVASALVIAGLVSVPLAIVQTFAPSFANGDWIAQAGAQGRAGGNLRQPNHLSSLLLWSLVALVWLHDRHVEKSSAGAPPSQHRVVSALAFAALTSAIVLTASRTGTVCILMLGLWGALDRQLSPFTRRLLWAAPFVYALSWWGLSEWNHASGQIFAGDTQLHKSDLSSSRFAIWSNAWTLLKANPWLGVGWGEFNFAWSLTPFPDRPGAFFDHTHNLPLNLLVELGIPLGMLVLALLTWSLWKAFVACRITPKPHVTMVRAAFVMVLMMVVHSMLEYPLWYAYFLLPTAFALGICLGHSTPADEASSPETVASPWPRRVLIGASVALVLGTGVAVWDYLRVAKIFSVDDDDTTSLSYRIEQGQKSIFFAHHADYAAATIATHPSTAWKAFRRAPHLLLDTRLMMAWSKAYAEKGDIERARYIADRLREFRNPDSAEFFAECDKPIAQGESKPYQCTPATQKFTYQDFKLR
ncbi:MAG: Wzy polymerase domain-containing protein [Rhizobacter sp.]